MTRLVEAGGGAPLEAAGAGSAEAAAAVAARLAAHEPDLVAADCTRKCAVLASVPSSLVNALGRVQDCFVLADPNLPDCPIVFASEGFLKLSGYPCHEVVGRNCRWAAGVQGSRRRVGSHRAGRVARGCEVAAGSRTGGRHCEQTSSMWGAGSRHGLACPRACFPFPLLQVLPEL